MVEHELSGRVLQVNISRGGVPKRARPEAELTPLGFTGDVQAHPAFHGGPNKAVLLLASEVIDDLRVRGYPVFYGALGENITTAGLDPAQLRSGQRYRLGQAVIELTTIRKPCATLDVYGPAIKDEIYGPEVKAGDTASPRWAHSGFYASVVRTGAVCPDDIIALIGQAV